MENRQPYVLVGAVTLLLVVAIFGFVLWMARFSGEERDTYDIFFRQSVTGLSNGSPVTFSGVPVGQVSAITLLPETPEFVRVRIQVRSDVPVLEGTTAALQGLGFTGSIQVQLKGAMRGAPPIDTPGPYGVPVIPSTSSGLGELMESAPQVVERASILLARLNELFDDSNRASLTSILENLDTTTAAFASEAPAIRASLRESTETLKAATLAANKLAAMTESADAVLREDAKPLIGDLRRAVQSADALLVRMETVTAAAEPGVQSFSAETIPEANRMIRELREVAEALGAMSRNVGEDPLGSFVRGRQLPDYQPEQK
ncbi:MAG: MlaD family protein [Sphingomonadaceae bacterium]